MKSNPRQLQVLRAIVSDYVRYREPVGSRHIVDHHQLGVSPATIRNDMAALEEEGLIHQPHTSAGRVPTDKGYRYFVDQITEVKPLSAAERRAIMELLDGAVDMDDILRRTVRLLSQLTQQVAVVGYPLVRHTVLRHVELVPLSKTRLMVVVICENGRVEQVNIDAGQELAEAELAHMRSSLISSASGRKAQDAQKSLTELATNWPLEQRTAMERIAKAVHDAISDEVVDRIVMAGQANLARFDVDFTRSISPVLEALEEQVVLLKLLSEMAEDAPLSVRIGEEISDTSLAETSIIAGAYGTTGSFGHVGIVGPTRMDYPSSMAAVRAVARYLSKILSM